MSKRLIIAPHADDEVLGCSSLLDKDAHVGIISINEGQIEKRPEPEDRKAEMLSVQNRTGIQLTILSEQYVNSYEMNECIQIIEAIINKIKPEEIYIPFEHSYNQDHQIVYNAAMIALRQHDVNWFVPKVLVYEPTNVSPVSQSISHITGGPPPPGKPCL